MGNKTRLPEIKNHPLMSPVKPPKDQEKTCVYLAGPMTGLPDNNEPAFNEMAKRLREAGLEVVNPAELIDEVEGRCMTHREMVRRDMAMMLERGCTVMALIPGWGESKGVMALELPMARLWGMLVVSAEIFVESVETTRIEEP